MVSKGVEQPKGAEHDKTRVDGVRPTPPGGPEGPPPYSPALPLDPMQDIRSLGQYRILRRLGEGGMGAVFLGYNGKDDKQVALKVLNDQLAGSQGYVDRFYREAKSGQALEHPNIVRTLGVGQDRTTGKHYLVLEYVDGPSAHALLDRLGPLPVGDAVHIALDIARALEHAHSRNIVHRDIKPDNILLTLSGVAKLGDLGLAKRLDEASHLTVAKQGFGTTAYMPYEQAVNAKYADGRSDIYALGATLYHLLTGKVPFPGDNHLEVVEKKNQGYYVPASALNDKVSVTLDGILAKMLARHPRDRYQTASEVIIDLERSRLSAPVPAFADPELARNDPWVQACMNSGEPTRLDPQATPRPDAGGEAGQVWLVRFAGPGGKERTIRLDTEQLARRLRKGTVPGSAEARPAGEGKGVFRPIGSYPEFEGLVPDERDEQGQERPTDAEPGGLVSWLTGLARWFGGG